MESFGTSLIPVILWLFLENGGSKHDGGFVNSMTEDWFINW